MTNSSVRFEKHINILASDINAVEILSFETNLSKQQIKQIMLKGAVWLTSGNKTQRLRRHKKVLHIGDTLHIYYDSIVLSQVPQQAKLISDEGNYSVWNKPYGMLSQGSKWSDHCTITRWAEQHLIPQRPSFLVHRLDRAASGLILVAHGKSAATKLADLFKNRMIDKRYHIWVHGQFNEESLSSIKIDKAIDGKKAISNFKLLEYDPKQNRSLLDVSIETGRKHQIRRHSAILGFPVVGDRLYGNTHDREDLMLRAYYLSFICPFTLNEKVFSLDP